MTLSAVIATFDRCELCMRAVSSVLEQTVPVERVVVVDDGSTDGTERTMREWSAGEPRLEYVRLPANAGRPAVARNEGLRHVRTPWVAFLDDDDAWLPIRLERQQQEIASGDVDLVCANADRSSGGKYFSVGVRSSFDRRHLIRENPVILSTVSVRVSLVQSAGGFPEARAVAGIEDYCLWLALADLGARIVRLPEPLALYRDAGVDRFSEAALRQQRATARIARKRWRGRPLDSALAEGAAIHTWRATKLLVRDVLERRKVLKPGI